MAFNQTIGAVAAVLAAILLSVPVFWLAERLARWFVPDSHQPKRIRPRSPRSQAFNRLPEWTPLIRVTIGLAGIITLALVLVLMAVARLNGWALPARNVGMVVGLIFVMAALLASGARR